MPKETYYFSHDLNARNDPKCSALISDFGMEGYGVFWAMIEIISEQSNYKLEKFPKLYDGIAKQLMMQKEALLQVIEAMLKQYFLLQEDQKYIWSESLLRRMSEKDRKRQAKIEAGRQGGIKSGISRNAVKQNEALLEAKGSELEANEPKESKVKENIKDIYIVDSEYLWSLYPDKSGKQNAMKKLPKLIKEYGKDQIERCIKRYLEDVDKRRANGFAELRYKNGSTFFNSGYVDFLDENVHEEVNPPVRKLRPIILDMVTK